MASVKSVKHRDGTVVYRVRYRAGGRNPVVETFYDAASANRFADLVDRVGGAAAREMRSLDDLAAADTPTVAAACEHHLEALAASATPGTISRYRQIVRDRIEPSLGLIPVDMLTRHAVTKWVAEMRRTPVARGVTAGRPPSAKTIRNAQALLSAALQRLVNEDVIPRNVAKGVPLPKDAAVREMRFLTPDEYARLHAQIPADYQPFVAAMYALGLRFGEATALTAADVDLDVAQPVVRVSKAWKMGENGTPYLGAPKTKRARRTVTIPAPLIPELRAALAGKGADDLVFAARRGGPITSGPFHAHIWQPACDAAGLSPRPRVHDLRHSHASALIAAGVPLPVVQRRMGHESIQTTVDVYGHLAPDAYAGAAEAMSVAMGGVTPQIEM